MTDANFTPNFVLVIFLYRRKPVFSTIDCDKSKFKKACWIPKSLALIV